jgi:hypothetical protein
MSSSYSFDRPLLSNIVTGYHFSHYVEAIDAHKTPAGIELITESYQKEIRSTQVLVELMSDLRCAITARQEVRGAFGDHAVVLAKLLYASQTKEIFNAVDHRCTSSQADAGAAGKLPRCLNNHDPSLLARVYCNRCCTPGHQSDTGRDWIERDAYGNALPAVPRKTWD